MCHAKTKLVTENHRVTISFQKTKETQWVSNKKGVDYTQCLLTDGWPTRLISKNK